MPTPPETRRVRILTATDLHQNPALYRQLAEATRQIGPDAVVLAGDFLDASRAATTRLSQVECAAVVAELAAPQIVVTRGNHENRNYQAFAAELDSRGRPPISLHGESHAIGPLILVGFPSLFGDHAAFTANKAPLPGHPDDWLPGLVSPLGPAGRTLWIAHEPPFGTVLSVPSGPVAGHPEWALAIHRYQPRVFLCGHDHTSPKRTGRWHARLGNTTVVNVGQPDPERLHFAVLDFHFATAAPSLPPSIQITAQPWNQSIRIQARTPRA